jgi:apolipoprotein N-acyltransferase
MRSWLERWRRPLLAVAAGLAMAVALPGVGLWPLIFAVPGLLRRALGGVTGWRAFGVGWLAGLAQWLVAVAWVVIVLNRYGNLGLPLALVGLVLMVSILALGWGLVALGVQRSRESWRPWVLPLALAAWIFPWNPAASSVAGVPLALLPAPVIGAAGLSLVLFLFGAGLDLLMSRGTRKAGAVTVVVALALWGGSAALAPGFEASGAGVRVAAIQPNVPLEMRWDADKLRTIEDRVWRLTEQAKAQGAAWVVWPESAVPRLLEHDSEFRDEVESRARRHGIWLLLGSIGFGAGGDQYFNSVYSASPVGLAPQRYDKVHLVPFGEYVPTVGLLPFLRPLVHEVGGFTPGTSLQPLPGPAGPVGVAVCYEVAYPSLSAGEVKLGAEVLATITNDGWYGDSAAPRQHLALVILRAAECRRHVVRAANTGISALIDPYGRITERLGFGREGMITGKVVPGRRVTPYVAFGHTVRTGLVVLALGAIILASRRRAN